jgi:hypothetical protein
MHHEQEYMKIDRVERLINRRLDAQNSPAEDAELDRLLAADPAARALAAEYLHMDQCAALALRTDAAPTASKAATLSKWNGWHRGLAAALISAAAVIAFSFAPELWRTATITPRVATRTHNDNSAQIMEQPAARFVDYRPTDFHPVQRQRGLQRDLIGVRGDNPNLIYVLERNTLSTRLVPITGDF